MFREKIQIFWSFTYLLIWCIDMLTIMINLECPALNFNVKWIITRCTQSSSESAHWWMKTSHLFYQSQIESYELMRRALGIFYFIYSLSYSSVFTNLGVRIETSIHLQPIPSCKKIRHWYYFCVLLYLVINCRVIVARSQIYHNIFIKPGTILPSHFPYTTS